jgi:hypothetical protein
MQVAHYFIILFCEIILSFAFYKRTIVPACDILKTKCNSFIYLFRATWFYHIITDPKIEQMHYYNAIIPIGTELPGAKSTKYDYKDNFRLFDWLEIYLKANTQENIYIFRIYWATCMSQKIQVYAYYT